MGFTGKRFLCHRARFFWKYDSGSGFKASGHGFLRNFNFGTGSGHTDFYGYGQRFSDIFWSWAAGTTRKWARASGRCLKLVLGFGKLSGSHKKCRYTAIWQCHLNIRPLIEKSVISARNILERTNCVHMSQSSDASNVKDLWPFISKIYSIVHIKDHQGTKKLQFFLLKSALLKITFHNCPRFCSFR